MALEIMRPEFAAKQFCDFGHITEEHNVHLCMSGHSVQVWFWQFLLYSLGKYLSSYFLIC